MGDCIAGTVIDVWIEQGREDKTEPWNFPERHGGFRENETTRKQEEGQVTGLEPG